MMTPNKQIKVTIDQLGNPKIEALGFAGVGCEAATKGLEDKLGNGAVTRELKGEFYATETEGETEKLTW